MNTLLSNYAMNEMEMENAIGGGRRKHDKHNMRCKRVVYRQVNKTVINQSSGDGFFGSQNVAVTQTNQAGRLNINVSPAIVIDVL